MAVVQYDPPELSPVCRWGAVPCPCWRSGSCWRNGVVPVAQCGQVSSPSLTSPRVGDLSSLQVTSRDHLRTGCGCWSPCMSSALIRAGSHVALGKQPRGGNPFVVCLSCLWPAPTRARSPAELPWVISAVWPLLKDSGLGLFTDTANGAGMHFSSCFGEAFWPFA